MLVDVCQDPRLVVVVFLFPSLTAPLGSLFSPFDETLVRSVSCSLFLAAFVIVVVVVVLIVVLVVLVVLGRELDLIGLLYLW